MKKYVLTGCISLFSIFAFGQIDTGNSIWPLDSCDFEACSWAIPGDEGQDSLWEFGTPQKVLFDSAYSGSLCWVTDTLNNYGDGRDDYFTVLLPVESPSNLVFSFWHRFDTDTLKDGGIVEVSFDKGNTYQNYYETFDQIIIGNTSANVYKEGDTLYDGRSGFSGSSNGWIYSRIQWVWALPVKNMPDSIYVRFRFISDSTGNAGDGWIIDNMDIQFVDFPGSIVDQGQRITLAVAPNPVLNQARISFETKPGYRYALNVVNITGKNILTQQNLPIGEALVDLSEFPAGQYWIMLTENDRLVGRTAILKE